MLSAVIAVAWSFALQPVPLQDPDLPPPACPTGETCEPHDMFPPGHPMDQNTVCIKVTSDNNRIMCIHYPNGGGGENQDEVDE